LKHWSKSGSKLMDFGPNVRRSDLSLLPRLVAREFQ
jgi:hypothetical protein